MDFFTTYSCSYYSSMIERCISMAASADSYFFENIAEWLQVFSYNYVMLKRSGLLRIFFGKCLEEKYKQTKAALNLVLKQWFD